MNGLFMTGTNTDVGKTWVGVNIIRQLIARKINVIPRKPVESGWPATQDYEQLTDAYRLADAAGCLETLESVCPNRFTAALSPVRAARMENSALTLKMVKSLCIQNFEKNDFLYVEGAGGFYSPLVEDGLNADLASSLNLPIVLVADNRLGCMSQILLCCEAIEKRQLKLASIILNQVEETTSNTAMNNEEDLKDYLSYPIFSLSHQQTTLPEPLIDLLY